MTRLVDGADYTFEPIRRRLIFEDDGWCIYRWDDRTDYQWSCKFTMWHKCGIEQDHAVREKFDENHMCVRCDVGAPDGLVALYEMFNWDENKYGGVKIPL